MFRCLPQALIAGLLTASGLLAAEEREATATPDGREIFERVWVADDPRSHGGDGLGPVFNAKSCVACHEMGGPGGAGGFEVNVQLLSVTLPPFPVTPSVADSGVVLLGTVPVVPTADQPAPSPEEIEDQRKAAEEQRTRIVDKLVEQFHPDFRESDTIVIHAHGTDEAAHAEWRQRASVPATQMTRFLGGRQILTGGDVPFGGPASFNFNPVASGLVVSTFDASSFPVLAELAGRVATLKGEANQGTSSSTAFEGVAALRTSQRNTTALWGAGLVDRISDEDIEEIARRQHEAEGRVSGRPHRLADGRIGKFGWKGQKASLYDFTIAACANELGLEVPGAKQAAVAYRPDHEPGGFDLDEAEVQALVDHIASLAAPRQLDSENAEIDGRIETGRDLFTSVGCAECHAEKVGEVVGLYSDLLLHDLGADLGSVGSYGVPSIPESDPDDVPIAEGEKPVPPTSSEWRTAPLWGVGSSAPYLHDGRAKTLEQAIAFHGGEADESRLRFLLLRDAERQALLSFLESLVAPEVASR